ncbi:MAG: DUF192 domain-containing protein [Sphingorhabdus sp.]
MRNRLYICAIALAISTLAVGCSLPANGGTQGKTCSAGEQSGTSEAGLGQVTLCITSGSKTRAFTVEVAANSMEQAKGMMFRTELADNRGMIFPFPEARMASFWMKNTVIPLDIIFIRANGTIESIAENAIPYSTVPVEAGEPVTAVLELRGGLAAELGIGAGDKVRWQSK